LQQSVFAEMRNVLVDQQPLFSDFQIGQTVSAQFEKSCDTIEAGKTLSLLA
jgi:hypothetical protein